MATAGDHAAGQDWLAILSRPTLNEFAAAFTADAVLEALVLTGPIIGIPGIRAFFQATRGMYDRIAFTSEYHAVRRSFLEWEGVYGARPMAGLTTLIADATGLIERVRLFYMPFDELLEFAADLQLHLGSLPKDDR